jgi:pimeloyl-ACP methyl ester carboxylesterase
MTVHHARSADGTRIGYVTSGTGPSLVMVHGATADHTALSGLVPLLEPHYTVHAVDRRGRGLSGDGPSYDIGLEYADIAAVVDRVAAETGEPVSLYGHSYGAVCALGASRLTPNLERLFLYEPGFRGVVSGPDAVLDRVERLISAGCPDAALGHFYRFGVGMTDDEVAAMRGFPSWAARVSTAATIAREVRTAAALAFDPTAYEALRVPTVLILGERSTPGQKAVVGAIHEAGLPSTLAVLPDQAHAAQVTAPGLLAAVLLQHVGRGRHVSRPATRS